MKSRHVFCPRPSRARCFRQILALSALLLTLGSSAADLSPLQASIKHAAAAGRTLFLIFRQDVDKELQAMQAEVALAVKELDGRAASLEVNVDEEDGEALLETYRALGAPLPLTLVLAPNGAITGSAVRTCKAETLKAALLGPRAAECLKHVQNGKLVAVCVQNGSSQGGPEALTAIEALKADPKIGSLATSVVIDPAAVAERTFLEKLGVDTKAVMATTVLIIPPGRILGVYSGAIVVGTLLDELTRGMSGGCGTCADGATCE